MTDLHPDHLEDLSRGFDVVLKRMHRELMLRRKNLGDLDAELKRLEEIKRGLEDAERSG